MSEIKLARCRIKEGNVNCLREWYQELEERKDEVVETLKHEGVYTESAFIDSVDGVEYLHIYMEASELEKALEAGDKEKYEIDEEHHEVLGECLNGEWIDLEPLGHFTNPDRV